MQSAEAASATPAVLTFLIADVRGYTRFTQERGDEAAARLAAKFADLTEVIVGARDGRVIELRGDEALAVFHSARGALRAALELQERFTRESEAEPELPLAVGIGLDAGEAVPVKGGYRGGALNLAARLCSLAGPGEVLASEGVVHLARKLDGVVYAERGLVQLKGFGDPVGVVSVQPSGAGASSPSYTQADAGETPAGAGIPIGGFLGALPSGLLVERQEELREVRQAVDAVTQGAGRLVALVGEPGVGKTRLAQEITLDVRNRGFIVATGRCYEPEQAVAYYPFGEALSTLYATCPSTIRAEVPRRWPDVQRLLPAAAHNLPAPSGGPEERQRLFWAVTGFVQAVAEASPVALMLDDLHWADDSSLTLLQHLARNTRAHRVLLLGTYRDVEVRREHPLERVVRDLHREGLIERVPVRRFGKEGTAALMAAIFGESEISDEFTSLVYRHTEGNPFFTREVLRSLVERGDVYRENGRWERRGIEEIEVPESIRSTIGERLSRLSRPSQEVLSEASVLGQTFGFEELQELSDRPEEEVEASLDEAAAVGLIADMRGDRYAFSHALMQQALYAELPTRRRRRLHRAAGDALERLLHDRKRHENADRRAAELAWHFLEADDAERALKYALLAGDQAVSVFAQSEAEKHYRTAAELAQELGNARGEAMALEKLGGMLHDDGRYDEALEVLDRAAATYAGIGELEGQRTATAELARVHAHAGTPDQGAARIRDLLARMDDSQPTRGLADLYAALSSVLFARGRDKECLAAAERASALARIVGDDRIFARAEVRRGTELLNHNDGLEARTVLEGVVPLLERLGDLRTLSVALNNLAHNGLIHGRLDENLQYRQRSLQVVERGGGVGAAPYSLAMVADAQYLLGNLAEAGHIGERAVDLLVDREAGWYSSYPLIALGAVRIAQGRWDEARRFLEAGITTATRNDDVQAQSYGQVTIGELDILDGHPERAAAVLAPYAGVQSWATDWLACVRAWACLEAGDEREAADLLAPAIESLRTHQARTWLSEALWIQGALLGRQARWAQAEESFDDALSLARGIGYRLAEGRALHERGVMHASRGDAKRARRDLEEALALFQTMGANGYVQRAERTLAAQA